MMGCGSSEVTGHVTLSLPMICVVENEVEHFDDEVEEHINLD